MSLVQPVGRRAPLSGGLSTAGDSVVVSRESPLNLEDVARIAGRNFGGARTLPALDALERLKAIVASERGDVATYAVKYLALDTGAQHVPFFKALLFTTPHREVLSACISIIAQQGDRQDRAFLRKAADKLPEQARKSPLPLKSVLADSMMAYAKELSAHFRYLDPSDRIKARAIATDLWPKQAKVLFPHDDVLINRLHVESVSGEFETGAKAVTSLVLNFGLEGRGAVVAVLRGLLIGDLRADRVEMFSLAAELITDEASEAAKGRGDIQFIGDVVRVLTATPRFTADEGIREIERSYARREIEKCFANRLFGAPRIGEFAALLGDEIVPHVKSASEKFELTSSERSDLCEALLASGSKASVAFCGELNELGQPEAQKALGGFLRKSSAIEPLIEEVRAAFWKRPDVALLLRLNGQVPNVFGDVTTATTFANYVVGNREALETTKEDAYRLIRTMQEHRQLLRGDPEEGSEESNLLVAPLRTLFKQFSTDEIVAFPIRTELDADNIGRLLYENVKEGKLLESGKAALEVMLKVFRSSGRCKDQLLVNLAQITDPPVLDQVIKAVAEKKDVATLKQFLYIPMPPTQSAEVLLQIRSCGDYLYYDQALHTLQRNSTGDTPESRHVSLVLALLRGNEESIRTLIARQMGEDPHEDPRIWEPGRS